MSSNPLRSSLGIACALALFLWACAPERSGPKSPVPAPVDPSPKDLLLCSFNIQFLGLFKSRDNEGLAALLREEGCDLVVVQELVAPPAEDFLARNRMPNQTPGDRGYFFPISQESDVAKPIRPSQASTDFFAAMETAGFAEFLLSEEDTGPKNYQTNSSASEWWVVFYNPKRLQAANDLPHGFLGDSRVSHPEFERVPYAFPLRTLDGKLDFVLISTHFAPGKAAAPRRRQELAAVRAWIDAQESRERDYIILGDMNFEGLTEIREALPAGMQTLNDTCLPTNTVVNPRSARCYDHVLIDPKHTTDREIDPSSFQVIDLRERMRSRWELRHPDRPYPGDPAAYLHDEFRTEYSDHHPVRVTLRIPAEDDDL